ncbi:PEP-CTERM sorting domain-containing protein [Pontiella sulfatireligans]|uniref:PEP-CTERM protein-sorting domain-containing protein n=1 Tax=Pontiella sulfatireligans TaxID=2750658 RepID=A0A6C2UFL4_9BACT|nr:PEP-CTERM sorting domain-containing protein [Pontiella sulfatireligans]VGO18317.1 hypothetical protein SCARR_00369 [Pontiella sulfatireligans]
MKKIVWAVGIAVLMAGVAQAGTLTWDGEIDGRWDRGENWDPNNGTGLVKINDTTADIKIAGTTQLNQYLRSAATIRSLEFTDTNVGLTQIGLNSGELARNLTFSADSGNSTLTVDALATGDKAIGIYGEVVSLGTVNLVSDLDITHNGTGELSFYSVITGSRDITISGAGVTAFRGDNTYTGKTTVNAGSTLNLIKGGAMSFTIGTDGVNNSILGSGTLSLNNEFLLDLGAAGTTVGESWLLVAVDTLDEDYALRFKLTSSANGAFTEASSGVWSINENGVDYEFAESTGTLTVIPEPATLGLVVAAGASVLFIRRRFML